MAKFGHPDQHHHMHAGIKAAIASPKTPEHLKAHLQKRLTGKVSPQTGKESIKPLPNQKPMTKPDPFFGEM